MIQSNTHETAAAIVLNGYCSGYFCCPDDAIWFKFTPTTTRYYTIYSTGYTDVKAQLYNSSLVYITQGDDEDPGDNFEITTELTANQTYYIKVTTFNSEGSFNIYVTADVQVEAVIIDPEFITLNNGSSTNLTATVLPTYATNQDLYWQSGNTNIATVDSNGRVTAVGGGETCICAYAQDGSNKSSCCRVVVPVYATDMKLQTSGNIAYMTQPFSITPIFTPYNTTNKAVTWCSSDTSIAEMGSNGKLITHKPGNVKITAISHDGSFSDSVDIRVVYDKITIMKDGNYNKVVFEYGNKEWLCVNTDLLYDYEYDGINIELGRGYHNVYVNVESPETVDHTVKVWNDEELKVLYAIDPFGVAFYVHTSVYTDDVSLEKALEYKDHVFELLFKRKPRYYARNVADGSWYEVDKQVSQGVASESECIFGMHPIYDWITNFEVIGFVIDIVGMVWGKLPFNGPLGESVKLAGKIFLRLCTAGQLALQGDLDEFLPGSIVEKSFIETKMDWANDFISIYDGISDILESIGTKPNFYDDIFEYCVDGTSYDIQLILKDNTIKNMIDLKEALIN